VSAPAIDELAAFDTGTLAESGATPFAPGLRPVSAGGRLVGRALTVACPAGQNLMLHRAVARAEAGDVIVAACGDAVHGYWGEVLAEAALARGVRGLVIDGAVRDVEALRELGFAVFSAGLALPGTGKAVGGDVGEPVTLRGATVRSGDAVVADETGVVAVAAAALGDVLERARARAEGERRMIEQLRAGSTTVELLGLPEA
jgi:4-hydroxy-4-methyl-2-oxoglutarate aldolase